MNCVLSGNQYWLNQSAAAGTLPGLGISRSSLVASSLTWMPAESE
jgi:hypothetical protein